MKIISEILLSTKGKQMVEEIGQDGCTFGSHWYTGSLLNSRTLFESVNGMICIYMNTVTVDSKIGPNMERLI